MVEIVTISTVDDDEITNQPSKPCQEVYIYISSATSQALQTRRQAAKERASESWIDREIRLEATNLDPMMIPLTGILVISAASLRFR